MTETVLPGVLIEVRPEGLIVPGAITVGNVGVVGTAGKGAVGTPQLLGSYSDATGRFGAYDRWVDGASGELTLVRALEQAYRFGASTVWAVRVADSNAVAATADLASPTGPNVTVAALSPGTWGNELTVAVSTADANAVVGSEEVAGTPPTLAHSPVVHSAVNRILVRPAAGGADAVPGIVYDAAPGPTQVGVDTTTGVLTFGSAPGAGDVVLATYTVAKSAARKVTITLGVAAAEEYSVVSGDDLVADLAASSALVSGTALANSAELPDAVATTPLTGGANGAAGADYQTGLDALLGVDAHIIVAAGQDQSFGDDLAAHTAAASGDAIKRERIAVVGTALENDRATFVQDAAAHTLNSDRVILVAPGITAADRSQSPPATVTLPGAYAAAAVAGLLSSQPPHISLTNKVLAVDGLEHSFSSAELKQLVLSRLLAIESRQGFRLVRGITTSTNTAWTQITTRRIVDYAKYGVRSAATPYIGLLNNERVRGALRATLNSFLTTMVLDEMLVSYELDVHASRDDEIRGIALVDLVIRPTFSIDFIKVTMFLE
ncbi:phage tail sheath C-terminal domain-containing protein [Pengzhenrongella sicca]|uniref:Phage tail sheath subtilisin-like domain-containing protein n=1 Tax=Pengzhenrongella sicca TaxID=2819238 RepID=A0A8A4ZNR8_9MICO|nr:phage tail sheath C-terminal domain-containing protein [Pengzhenrongella sicca]QTE31198.1 phage tail sheath subtilisin-like domain-containing protein [Pengzhenrongella sicca]